MFYVVVEYEDVADSMPLVHDTVEEALEYRDRVVDFYRSGQSEDTAWRVSVVAGERIII
jgi:hypothetical protein